MGGRAFLPAALRVFLKRRIFELVGLGLLTAAAVLAVALASYDPSDPSLNNATYEAPRNLAGLPGAYAADLMLQALGLAAWLPVVTLLVWGFGLLRHRVVPLARRRILLLPCATAFASITLAAFGAPQFWSQHSGLGGALGDIAFAQVQRIDFGVAVGAVLLAMLAAATVASWLYMLAIPPVAWLRSGFAAARGARHAVRLMGSAAGFAITGTAWVERTARRLSGRRRRLEPRLDPPEKQLAESAAAPAPQAGLGRDTRVAPRPGPVMPGRRGRAARQQRLDLPVPPGAHEFPPLDLLTPPPGRPATAEMGRDNLEQNARLLEAVLEDFGVRGEIVKVRPGPVVTLYELEPAPGTKTSRVIGLAGDIARSMSAVSVRIAVVPGRSVIGIELPNMTREVVTLYELLASAEFEKAPGTLTLALGKDIGGAPVLVDLARMPHLLVAGTTGSGKSVGLNAMIVSLLYRLRPDDCKFIMIDPKMLELSVYDGIPHLLAPVVTDPKKAVVALKWVVREMENRYRAMSLLGVRNIAGYNQRLDRAGKRGEVLIRKVQTGYDAETGKPVFEDQPLDTTRLPQIVVVVDEMADLMLVSGKDVEAAIQRLSQMARAAGIHLIMATQRPSVDVVTGTIKANFPTRVSFQVTTKVDSRTILGEQGAEQLLGMGDMLYMAGGGRITRVHGPLVADADVEEIVAFLKAQGEPDYLDDVTEDEDAAAGIPGFDMGRVGSESDQLYDEAVALVARERKASTSFIQRHLQIGYNRAARIIERMEKQGVVGAANHVGKREVLLDGE
ncbi:MAG: DNA translocase FtsK [Alphaproteobacteria bacterium]